MEECLSIGDNDQTTDKKVPNNVYILYIRLLLIGK